MPDLLAKISKPPIHIISLGAGVQSSTMALMAACGEITPMPQAAIFADTKAEPKSVYLWLDWLEKQLPFPVYRVTQGQGLVEKVLRVTERKDKQGLTLSSGIPHYTRNPNGTKGHGMRQCTQDFKIAPLKRQAMILMKSSGSKSIIMWIGISLDEAHRMKPSRVQYATHIWPLIDLKMKRQDCLAWMEKHDFPKPPRSACVFCPYHSDFEWSRLKEEEPEEFSKAVKFERDYQTARAKVASNKGFIPFLHAQRIQLDKVDFAHKTKAQEIDAQLSLFGNECEGMCGV